MANKFLMRLLCQIFVNIFVFRGSHQEISPARYVGVQHGDDCLVHFGVQSDIPLSITEAFMNFSRLDHHSVLDSDHLLHGKCTEFNRCPAWRFVSDKVRPRWITPILRHLRCGISRDQTILLHCCPAVRPLVDGIEFVFPDEDSSANKMTEMPFTLDHNQHVNRRLLPGSVPSDCLQSATKRMGRILAGKTAHLGQYPWMVRLAYKPNDRETNGESLASRGEPLTDDEGLPKLDFRCGGVLLNDRYVLTAAHCLRATDDQVFMVRLGEHCVRTDPDCEWIVTEKNRRVKRCADSVLDVAVIDSIVHEKFDQPYRQNDIALLRLNTSIKSTKWIRPICLPFDWPSLRQMDTTSSNPVVIGFGRDESFNYAETLQEIRLPWFNTTECATIYAGQSRSISVSESLQFCLGGAANRESSAGDACQGDSGGPVMMSLKDGSSKNNRTESVTTGSGEEIYAVGIISFGPWMCGNGFPSVYTWLPAYLQWILNHIMA